MNTFAYKDKPSRPLPRQSILRRSTLIAAVLFIYGNVALAIPDGSNASQPWLVQLAKVYETDTWKDCTGTALSADIILTSESCASMNRVLYPDGTTVNSDAFYPVTVNANLSLLVLTAPKHLSDYPTLGADMLNAPYSFPPGTLATVYGYGGATSPSNLNQPKENRVQLKHYSATGPKGEVLRVTGRNNEIDVVEYGDSGGPLFINNQLVGVIGGWAEGPLTREWAARESAIGKGTHQYTEYFGVSSLLATIRKLEHDKQLGSSVRAETATPWINAVAVENGTLSVTLNNAFMNTGNTINLWSNGRYLGSIANTHFGNFLKSDAPGGVKFSLQNYAIKNGDVIQLTVGPNTPGAGLETAHVLYENRYSGIDDVALNNGNYAIKANSALVHSGQRIIIWLDGIYQSEIFNGTIYYNAHKAYSGGRILSVGPATANSNLQIGVVSGSPGEHFGTPETAKQMLYETLR